MHWLALLVVGALLVAGCGVDEGSTEAGSTVTTSSAPELPSTSAAPATTTAPSSTEAADTGDSFAVLTASDIVYHEEDGEPFVMHVSYPDGGGPWPLVVVYHGRPAGPALTEARTIAERGAVAVAPQWVNDWSRHDREAYIDGALFDRAACAVGKAQSVAGDFGADPANTIISGYSAGMHPAGWVGLGAVRNDVCAISAAHRPVGLVLGDNQFFFFEDGWDASFDDPTSSATDTTDRFVNPERWDVPDDLAVYLWTSDATYGRSVDNPVSAESWIWDRDTTGTLVEELQGLGAFDDEWVDWTDNALLVEQRMRSVGIDVVHESIGGGHHYQEPVYDAIERIGLGQ